MTDTPHENVITNKSNCDRFINTTEKKLQFEYLKNELEKRYSKLSTLYKEIKEELKIISDVTPDLEARLHGTFEMSINPKIK
jgi:hypothetical protein